MGVSVPIFILVALFGSSSWMGTNSVWMQLPLLTSDLPEKWNLPSYLAAVVQIGCIAPLIYSVLHKGVKELPTPPLIFGFLTLACACQLGLAFLWQDTTEIFGEQRSLPLYLLLFGLAIVNAISNVLFMPFMAKFQPAYLNAYFTGMGLSSLVPSLLSLIQGSSNLRECNNGIPSYYPPHFSVSVFFFVIFVWTCIALVAFGIIYYTGAHNHEEPRHAHEGTPLNDPNRGCPSPDLLEPGAPAVETYSSSSAHEEENNQENASTVSIKGSKTAVPPVTFSRYNYALLLLATAIVNAQMNGVIPSIQSYATLPYSQATYHYGITLANVVSPLATFLPFLYTIKSLPILQALTVCSSIVTAFIIYLAALSPNLIFDSVGWGSALAITSSLIAAGLHSYLRVVFASLLRESLAESALFWCGVFIQIGSFIGSAVMFPLVNFAHLFQSAPVCKV